MIRRLIAAFLLMLLVLPFAGCNQKEASLLASDANGYYCPDCNAKLYTASDVYADHCPKCKSQGIETMVGYVCPVDQAVTIVPQNAKGAPCSKCGKYTAAKKLVSEQELQAWGAQKAEASSVIN